MVMEVAYFCDKEFSPPRSYEASGLPDSNRLLEGQVGHRQQSLQGLSADGGGETIIAGRFTVAKHTRRG